MGRVFQPLLAKPMPNFGESAPFGIGEAQGAFEVRLHNSVFFHQVFAEELQIVIDEAGDICKDAQAWPSSGLCHKLRSQFI